VHEIAAVALVLGAPEKSNAHAVVRGQSGASRDNRTEFL